MKTKILFKIVFFTVFISVFSNCSERETFLIKSIWTLSERENFEAEFSAYCDDCNIESTECCVFKYKNKFYNRGESYILDENGGIDSIYSYKVPLGVNIISISDQISLTQIDTLYQQEIKTRKTLWNTKLKVIEDNNKVYKNFIIDKDNRFLVVKKDNQLILYGY